ncbi:hypothetical protein BH11PAT1_BH11PAT1_5680 [soil metagenome]
MHYILQKFTAAEQGQTISQLHGRLLSVTTTYGDISILPLYHPAVALYNISSKQTLLVDFQNIKKAVRNNYSF